jgi:hypothetical protein
MMVLLISSDYTILNSKKKLKYKEVVSWLSIIIGFIGVTSSITGLLWPVNFLEINKSMIILSSLLIILPTWVILTISGFFLRKIS